MQQKHIFTIGKGGTGKSTISALMATFFAQAGKKVRLVSFDLAHNLSDIFETEFSDSDCNIKDNLFVREINHERRIKNYLSDVENQIHQTYTYLSSFNLSKHFNIIKHSPGLEEYVLIHAFAEMCLSEAFEYTIFDMPPTSLSQKFFSLPTLSLIWLKHLTSLRKSILEKKEMINKVKSVEKKPTDKVFGQLLKQTEFFEKIKTNFENQEKCNIVSVVNNDRLSIEETRRTINNLCAQNIKTDKLVINRIKDATPLINSIKEFNDFHILEIANSKNALLGAERLKIYLKEESINFNSLLI